jgi:hypothetical protein
MTSSTPWSPSLLPKPAIWVPGRPWRMARRRKPLLALARKPGLAMRALGPSTPRKPWHFTHSFWWYSSPPRALSPLRGFSSIGSGFFFGAHSRMYAMTASTWGSVSGPPLARPHADMVEPRRPLTIDSLRKASVAEPRNPGSRRAGA